MSAIPFFCISILLLGFSSISKAAIPDAVHPDFEIKEVQFPAHYKTMGLGFLSDGRMVLAVTENVGMETAAIPDPDSANRVLLITGASTEALPASIVTLASHWKQISGIRVVEDQIYVSDRDGFYKITSLNPPVDTKGNRTLLLPWPNENTWNFGKSWHQWVFTPLFWRGYFYAPYSGSIQTGGWSNANATTSLSGAFLKWNLAGNLTAYAGGLRSPNGANLNPETGEMFATDNQGCWLPASTFLRIRPGRFYGHRQTSTDFNDSGRIVGTRTPNFAESFPYDPPVAWLPHNLVRSSPSQPVILSQGIYAGDWLIGDVNNPGLVRIALDRVGEELNGAVFWFSKGTENAAINRMAWDNKGGLILGTIAQIAGNWPAGEAKPIYRLWPKPLATSYDFKAIRSVAEGLELEFTLPILVDSALSSHISLKHFQYKRQREYGLGQQPEVPLAIQAMELSTDRKRLFLKVNGLAEDRVIAIKIHNLPSDQGQGLWNNEAWFTLNARSTRVWNKDSSRLDALLRFPIRSGNWKISSANAGHFNLTFENAKLRDIALYSLQGQKIEHQTSQEKVVSLGHSGLLPGVFILKVTEGKESFSGRVYF